MPAQNHLEISVENFGPIVNAGIDLRPLTVFIGPSNTGKSYLAILLYALHRFFSEGSETPSVLGRFRSRLVQDEFGGNRRPSESIIAAFERLVRDAAEFDQDQTENKIALPSPIVDLVGSAFNNQGQALGLEILRCFGLDETGTLNRKSRNVRARISIRYQSKEDPAPMEHLITFSTRGAQLQTTPPGYISIQGADWEYINYALGQIRRGSDTSSREYASFEFRESVSRFLERIVPVMFGDLHLPAYYLPADRTGVMHAHSAVVSAMLDNVPMAGLQPTSPTAMLSGVLTDFLSQLIQIDRGPRTRRPARRRAYLSDHGTQIEREILHGSVGVVRSSFINYPQFTYKPEGWNQDLPLMHASSMVSELAPVVLYLRHLVRMGNVLIVEEPESHLHPAMQVEFTRQLARLVQSGYRVIITTHSEWVLEELANVVRRSELPEHELSTISGSDAALSPDSVGVWLFRPKRRPRGSEVVPISLDESGLYPSGFDDVAVALHNDWANISERRGAN